jgi:uncharacterized protein
MKDSLVLKEVEFDGVSYLAPNWNQMGDYTFLLAKKIIDSGKKFDRVVALAKGGWTWARTIVDFLQIPQLSSTRLKSYSDINQCSRVQVLQPLSDSIDKERILIFDDVVDSGETIAKAKEYLTLLGAKKISTASLCYKTRSKFTPDFYAFTTASWVIFPHEHREFITQVKKLWLNKNISKKEIITRLLKIGISKNQIDYFLEK